mgnify:CR=1 FL=1
MVLIGLALIGVSPVFAGFCPTAHPYAYKYGQFCCRTNKEADINSPECNNRVLRPSSTCCQEDRFERCADEPCQNALQLWLNQDMQPVTFLEHNGVLLTHKVDRKLWIVQQTSDVQMTIGFPFPRTTRDDVANVNCPGIQKTGLPFGKIIKRYILDQLEPDQASTRIHYESESEHEGHAENVTLLSEGHYVIMNNGKAIDHHEVQDTNTNPPLAPNNGLHGVPDNPHPNTEYGEYDASGMFSSETYDDHTPVLNDQVSINIVCNGTVTIPIKNKHVRDKTVLDKTHKQIKLSIMSHDIDTELKKLSFVLSHDSTNRTTLARRIVLVNAQGTPQYDLFFDQPGSSSGLVFYVSYTSEKNCDKNKIWLGTANVEKLTSKNSENGHGRKKRQLAAAAAGLTWVGSEVWNFFSRRNIEKQTVDNANLIHLTKLEEHRFEQAFISSEKETHLLFDKTKKLLEAVVHQDCDLFQIQEGRQTQMLAMEIAIQYIQHFQNDISAAGSSGSTVRQVLVRV